MIEFPYKHPSAIQCNYSIDTSNFVTKTELNKVKGMIDVSARVVHSAYASIYHSTAGHSTVICTKGSDYATIRLNDSACPVTIAAGGTGIIQISSSNSEIVVETCNLSSNGTELQIQDRDATGEYINITFYKYDS